MDLSLIWIGTKVNPADHPSRNKALPCQKPFPDDLQALYSAAQFKGAVPLAPRTKYLAIEFYAGSGALSSALRKRGIPSAEVECYPDGVYLRTEHLVREEVLQKYEALMLTGLYATSISA